MTDAVIALDLGGTKLDSALVRAGEIVPGTRARTTTGPEITPDGLRAALRERIEAVAAQADPAEIRGIGMGAPGPFAHDGAVIEPVNMPLVRGFALAAEVAKIAAAVLGREVPVRCGHDGGCLALAEARYGAARGSRASMSIVVSTGIGGGIVVDGTLLLGATANAGHLGQTHTASGVTLEEVASGPSSVEWARAQGWDGSSGEKLGAAASAGNRIAREAIERSAIAVGHALCDAATLIDLDVVVVGGGFSLVSSDYTELVQESLRDRAALEYARRTRIVRPALGDAGPLIGAAALV